MPNNAAPDDTANDTIDRFITEWTAERPDLDFNYLATIGRILRATSLDELPQLINVFLGQMSLVGPRPIVNSPQYDGAYVNDYPHEFKAYCSMRPGLTGLAQVNSNATMSWPDRIKYDVYYVDHLGPRLDAWIRVAPDGWNFAHAADGRAFVPVGFVVAYGVARMLQAALSELREIVFTRVAQKAMHAGLDGNTHVTLHDYEGLDHGFADTFGARRNEEGAKLADKRTAEFFAKNVG